jgi:hypothetical protein
MIIEAEYSEGYVLCSYLIRAMFTNRTNLSARESSYKRAVDQYE